MRNSPVDDVEVDAGDGGDGGAARAERLHQAAQRHRRPGPRRGDRRRGRCVGLGAHAGESSGVGIDNHGRGARTAIGMARPGPRPSYRASRRAGGVRRLPRSVTYSCRCTVRSWQRRGGPSHHPIRRPGAARAVRRGHRLRAAARAAGGRHVRHDGRRATEWACGQPGRCVVAGVRRRLRRRRRQPGRGTRREPGPAAARGSAAARRRRGGLPVGARAARLPRPPRPRGGRGRRQPRRAGPDRGDGVLARCLQHEVDHLEGRVFVERLSRKERLRVLAEAGLAG